MARLEEIGGTAVVQLDKNKRSIQSLLFYKS